ncbi:vesicle trafficking protein, putative [Eimeria tenella]|uniref:Vesicle trafficking protein, putative n=1 Tax=Eimeria tenella TaxID=5802 RepID=U6KZ73_EIMTE|nr:vesicle trafficking protein, putative [Eimeria tenella]CDJ43437.1 vesicle trafficking protein, putative [Eimeria tenella]|eukprot:XP_013234187.1 vesicle trafficking protein, putative [Eimeria tenella]
MCDVTFIARTSDGLLLAEAWSPHFGSSSSSSSMQQQEQQQLKQQVKGVLQRLQGGAAQGAIEAGRLRFYYKLSQGVSYLTVCAAAYPRRLAFCYLEEIINSFEDELRLSFGARGVDVFAMLETLETPYHFIKFERVLQKKRQEYADPGSSRSLARLNESLAEVSDLMKQNIEEILQRGDNLSGQQQQQQQQQQQE